MGSTTEYISTGDATLERNIDNNADRNMEPSKIVDTRSPHACIAKDANIFARLVLLSAAAMVKPPSRSVIVSFHITRRTVATALTLTGSS